MGNAATRSLERVAASMGELTAAPIQFQAGCDVAQGGVLMALARIRSLEQLRYQAPGEWGKLLGLDRIPEVRTLRAKLKLLCQDMGRARQWNAELAKDWIAMQEANDAYFYIDGHVRVYHGDQTKLPRHHVARERLCQRATVDYWVNAMDGQPFLYVNKEVDPGLTATLKQDVIPWLEAGVPKTAEQERRLAEDPRGHWFTIVFDREGYSPELFEAMRQKRAVVARDPQGRCRRASDFDSDDELSVADDHAGRVAVRQMVSGELLPLYAGTLRFRPFSRVWNGVYS